MEAVRNMLWMPNAMDIERFHAPGQAQRGKFASQLLDTEVFWGCLPGWFSYLATGTRWMRREGWRSRGGGAEKRSV
ncbi:hypothetical protein TURU_121922 [Turdus rufiventris]|nr:hypothetical protein TURU_121922 [Turdus rufiventris]